MNSANLKANSRQLGKIAGIVTIFISLTAVIFGLVFIVVAVVVSSSGKKSIENYLPVEATIKEIRYVDDNHKPYVEYEVDGETYHSELNFYSSSMYEGQRIEVLYNPENPSQTASEDAFKIIGFVFGLIGGIFLVAGLIPMTIGIIATVKLSKAPKLSVVGTDGTAEPVSPADYSEQYNKSDDDRYGGLGEGIE